MWLAILSFFSFFLGVGFQSSYTKCSKFTILCSMHCWYDFVFLETRISDLSLGLTVVFASDALCWLVDSNVWRTEKTTQGTVQAWFVFFHHVILVLLLFPVLSHMQIICCSSINWSPQYRVYFIIWKIICTRTKLDRVITFLSLFTQFVFMLNPSSKCPIYLDLLYHREGVVDKTSICS